MLLTKPGAWPLGACDCLLICRVLDRSVWPGQEDASSSALELFGTEPCVPDSPPLVCRNWFSGDRGGYRSKPQDCSVTCGQRKDREETSSRFSGVADVFMVKEDNV